MQTPEQRIADLVKELKQRAGCRGVYPISPDKQTCLESGLLYADACTWCLLRASAAALAAERAAREKAEAWAREQSMEEREQRAAREKAEQERDDARHLLAQAAQRINCAGPVHHRIDVLRRQLTEDCEKAEANGAAMADALKVAEQERDELRELLAGSQRVASQQIQELRETHAADRDRLLTKIAALSGDLKK